jgi:hypothetical protein
MERKAEVTEQKLSQLEALEQLLPGIWNGNSWAQCGKMLLLNFKLRLRFVFVTEFATRRQARN